MTSHSKNRTTVRSLLIDKIGNPASVMVVKATLESFGIREKDVFKDYGFDNLDYMSETLFEDLKKEDLQNLLNLEERKNIEKPDNHLPISAYLWTKVKLLIQYYPLGLFHLFPVFLQILAIILFGYSLWAYLKFNILQSTAVVCGVILGLVFSGGYVQVIGKQASLYWHQGQPLQAKLIVDALVKSGIRGLGIALIIMALLNFIFQIYPFSFILVTLIYALLIGILLLVTAAFHTFKQRWMISVAIFLATALSLILKEFSGLHIYVTHWGGLVFAIIISKIYLYYFFKRYPSASKKPQLRMNRSAIVYKNYSYFLYGTLIYVFVFVDRILAWSADTGIKHDFVIIYEKNYEIGMDLAILIFFLLAGVMEYALAAFSKFLDIKQKVTPFVKTRGYNMSFARMYLGHLALLAITAAISALFLHLIVTQPWGYQASFGESLDPISVWVSVVGGIGYFFLTWGMLNSLYLFTLNQSAQPLRALMWGVLVNLTVGYVASRGLSYEYSAIGMLVGSVVFALLTTYSSVRFFKNIDYYYYAAF